jgi:DNA-binding NtrC family response regulator
MPGQRVLVVDDERLVRWSLGQRLSARGWTVTEAGSAAEAINAPAPDVAILDYKLPDGDGIEVLRRLRHTDPDLPVIMLTAHQDTELIVEAMKAGASDYLTKPFDVDEVVLRVTRAVENARGSRELRRLKEDLARPFSLDSVIGDSDVMQRLKTLAHKMAESPTSTVLLTGESGTGKDLLAKVIHFGGNRAARPFMNITCSALPETLLESELFGHERGAFTDARTQKRGLFEQADEGTVFLDEVAETVPTFQAKLLRFLEEKNLPPARRDVGHHGERPHHRCDEPGSREDGARRKIPAGSLLPPERAAPGGAAAPGARPRHCAAGGALHPPVQPGVPAACPQALARCGAGAARLFVAGECS